MENCAIPFAQYLRPNGRVQRVFFDTTPELFFKAKRIIDAGLRFEAEVLQTGMVSFTIYDPQTEEDVASQLCPNGPGVEKAVADLVADGLELIKGRVQ